MIGRRQVLGSAASTAPAAVGSRVYWRGTASPRPRCCNSRPPSRPARAARAHHPPLQAQARRAPAAALGLFVISRAGGDTWACRRGKTRLLARGAVTEFRVVGEREVAYARPGFVGVLDVVGGKRRELPSTGGALAADPRASSPAARPG